MQTIQRVSVVGAGVMGLGICQLALLAGCQVKLYDQNYSACQAGLQQLENTFAQLQAKGKISVQAQHSIKQLSLAKQLEELADSDVLIEAIVENLAIKQQLFQALEQIVQPNCILASNTSSLAISAIAKHCQSPQRIAGLHFFNPVPLMKVVEVVQTLHTPEALIARLKHWVQCLGHHAVVAQDSPGFIVNHAGRAFGTEALKILQEKVASVELIDQILKSNLGFKMGPFELMDLTGLDVSHPVMESIYQQYYQEPRYRPQVLTQQMLNSQRLGRKTAQGFYQYEDGVKCISETPIPTVPNAVPTALHLCCDFDSDRQFIEQQLQQHGITVLPKANAHCLILICNYGDDATHSALRYQVNPEQVVCLDLIHGLHGQLSLMPSLVTRAELLQQAQALVYQLGAKPICIGESLGFVAQRVIAMVVNLACDMAQQGIASVDDIDQAVRLGLGYPHGPLHWGDVLGTDKILCILQRINQISADPRYRPSPWLQRRSLLQLSLTYIAQPSRNDAHA